MKLIDAKKDHYRRLAHEQGYRSRASYKLKEINKSYENGNIKTSVLTSFSYCKNSIIKIYLVLINILHLKL